LPKQIFSGHSWNLVVKDGHVSLFPNAQSNNNIKLHEERFRVFACCNITNGEIYLSCIGRRDENKSLLSHHCIGHIDTMTLAKGPVSAIKRGAELDV
jgi:hypothetical protein